MPSCACSSLDLLLTMSCGLTLQIRLINAVIPLQTLEVWLCQWPSLTGMEHCCTRGHILKERTGSSSLNFFQAVYTRVVVESSQHQLLRACLLGSKRKLLLPACQVPLRLLSLVCHQRGVQFPFESPISDGQKLVLIVEWSYF